MNLTLKCEKLCGYNRNPLGFCRNWQARHYWAEFWDGLAERQKKWGYERVSLLPDYRVVSEFTKCDFLEGNE